MKTSQLAAAGVLVGLVLLAAGFGVGRLTSHDHGPSVAAPQTGEPAGLGFTCPMHPQVVVPEQVPCPLCGMALVEVSDTGGDPGPRRLRISEADAALAAIRTAPVERRFTTKRLRLSGEIEVDETRVRTVAARVPGRLDRLFVDFTGVTVRRGDHLVEIYSPDLFTAQQELLEARVRLDRADPGQSAFLAESDRRLFESAREKLLEWGLTPAAIDAVLARGTAEDRITLSAPTSGVVVHKNVAEGDYVTTGTRLYRIAELDRLWVVLSVYEKDLGQVRYGQVVQLTADALPGEVHEGRISFVAPVVDERTRTVRVRVQVDNPGGRLKPGMFVRARIEARLGDGGRILDVRLAGKWISPMHPEIVKDGPGVCDVCGMELVPAESLGYVQDDAAVKPLVIPYTAVLPTGRRAVVYVQVESGPEPVFEGREVVLGPRAGDDQVILAGLAEHERVVVSGAFKLDSALQIHARPSLLSAGPGGAWIAGPVDPGFVESLEPLWAAYFALGNALVRSDEDAGRTAFAALGEALGGVRPDALGASGRRAYDDERVALAAALAAAAGADLGAQRSAFHDVSRAMLAIDVRFGHAGTRVHRESFCPMAFDDTGAVWLQVEPVLANPYFGDEMLRCGDFLRLLPGLGGEIAAPRIDPVREPREDPEPAEVTPTTVPVGRSGSVTDVLLRGVAVQRALAADRMGDEELDQLSAVASDIDALVASAPEDRQPELRGVLGEVFDAAKACRAASDLRTRRASFEALSKALLRLVSGFGHSAGATLVEAHCPMAFDDRGASWLQAGEEILNPYFGSEMLRCGRVDRRFAPRRED
ncbi:MAG: efflux RND transporter periplasmic adaptor subunit [Planctomycetota bacterium]|nr:efflux RND transporter periplasmic adaptor subunit [Planctomycetota bacterium]